MSDGMQEADPVWAPLYPVRPDGTIVISYRGLPYQVTEDDPTPALGAPTLAEAVAAAAGLSLPTEPMPEPIPPLRREVPKLVLVDRLERVGLGAAAEAALAADGATRRRWQACNSVYADDQDVIDFLTAIGADPEEILEP